MTEEQIKELVEKSVQEQLCKTLRERITIELDFYERNGFYNEVYKILTVRLLLDGEIFTSYEEYI